MSSEPQFEKFALEIDNGTQLTGIHYIPAPPASVEASHLPSRPLLVLLHGGGCRAEYYDVDSSHSILRSAAASRIPVISINRPCYDGTTSFLPLQPGQTFHQATGTLEHEYIFPFLWTHFGQPNGCTGLVLVGHSMATPGIIVAAALHARGLESTDERVPPPKYPLAGIIVSGWGVEPNQASQEERLGWDLKDIVANRATLMLSNPKFNAADHERLRPFIAAQTVASPPEEAAEVVQGHWWTYWKGYAGDVRVPIMYGIGEHDWLWIASRESLDGFRVCFPRCTRFDGSVVLGAPHAIEWSYYSQGWLARCVGFAMECAAWHERKPKDT